jgi:hypothetical protein
VGSIVQVSIPHPAARYRPLPSLTTAAGILVAGIVLALVTQLAGASYTLLRHSGAGVFDYFLPVFGVSLPIILAEFVPVAVVAFLFFWGIAPIRPELRLGQAIARSFWAALVGLVATGMVLAVQYTVSLSAAGSLTNPGAATSVKQLAYNVVSAGIQTTTLLPQIVPLGMLAGILLWNWMRVVQRPRPDRAAVPDLV